MQLFTPQGLLVSPDAYNRLFTLHGVVMVWFFLVPSIPTTLGNFLLPLMIGAKDVAFPKLNLISWYLYLAGAALTIGGADRRRGGHGLDLLHALLDDLLQLRGAVGGDGHLRGRASRRSPPASTSSPPSTLLRAPGHDLVPPAAVRLGDLRHEPGDGAGHAGAGDLAAAGGDAERAFGLPIFDARFGGDPMLFQHLFWFYSHPAVYIMILPAMGVVSRGHHRRRAASALRLRLHGLRDAGDRGDRLPGLGPPHVRLGPEPLCEPGVLVPELRGRRAQRHQGVQLDGHPLPRPDQLRGADALRAGLPRPVHPWRADRAVARLDPDRRARDRHLLRHRPLPLHHGRRLGFRLLRRPALLVAEDHRAAVSGRRRQVRRDPAVLRLQLHLLPAVHHGLSRHAAALSRLSCRNSRSSTCCLRSAPWCWRSPT